VRNKNNDATGVYKLNYRGDCSDIYWGQNLQMIQTFLYVKLGEKVVCYNVACKLQKCCEGEEEMMTSLIGRA